MNTQERTALIQGMRDCADWLEQSPQFNIAYYASVDVQLQLKSYDDGQNQLANFARSGHIEKDVIGAAPNESIRLTKRFGPYVKAWDAVNRVEVCERVVVGTRIVEASPEYVIPARPQHEEEIIEWKCGSILEQAGGAS